MFTTIKGGREAIVQSHRLLDEQRRGDPAVTELSIEQIRQQLSLAVSRVMSEGALYDAELAGLAIKQSQGDLYEACFLLRAFRTTLPRFGFSEPLQTSRMVVSRRISTTHKTVPGGQILGPTYDYTYRLLNFDLFKESNAEQPLRADLMPSDSDRLTDPLLHQVDADLFELPPEPSDGEDVFDLTRAPLSFPTRRDQRLQNLTRGDEGFLLGLAYSGIRGYGRNHPFIAEIKVGEVVLEFEIPELGFVVEIGEITITECPTIHPTIGKDDAKPQFTKGYGIAFGHCERKAISMAIVDRSLRASEFGEERRYPIQDEEFVMSHTDNVASSGMVQHLKLPHYVDFQAQVQLMREIAEERASRRNSSPETGEIQDAE
ncbi:carbon-phosphorus lyase complex subunit PhnI [Rhizobium laguerreae]|uniref:carbon-phosphorus lyase complex subunit PhnI n=1 Tax=Rhizobium laguerreae TaxID=1076926 RepID=UPI0010392FC1|nr:carbon-phosphorus lyase complex subunit PhnI [Rhizobium laguerreae]TBX99092.1 carbon-phosphorus lyase complex subunit PhnI [Rhizobium laguerreae]